MCSVPYNIHNLSVCLEMIKILGNFENHERSKIAYEFSDFHSPVFIKGATATKASKAQALPKFWVTVNPISIRGANYAHHITMGLVWLKFAVAPL